MNNGILHFRQNTLVDFVGGQNSYHIKITIPFTLKNNKKITNNLDIQKAIKNYFAKNKLPDTWAMDISFANFPQCLAFIHIRFIDAYFRNDKETVINHFLRIRRF
jgi:hypothetical protein